MQKKSKINYYLISNIQRICNIYIDLYNYIIEVNRL